jgi:hypothetical protein
MMLEIAKRDSRITGGAITGSGAMGSEDDHSDVDVAFGVREEESYSGIFNDWTVAIDGLFGVVHQFDLPAEHATFRLFLLSDGLEVDVGLCPSASFGPRGKAFKLAFGHKAEVKPNPDSFDRLVGLCWHHALHAFTAIQRQKLWQAEYYVGALRDHVMELACLRLGLPALYARGIDQLPSDLLDSFKTTLAVSIDAHELERALAATFPAYVEEVRIVDPELARRLETTIARRWQPDLG